MNVILVLLVALIIVISVSMAIAIRILYNKSRQLELAAEESQRMAELKFQAIAAESLRNNADYIEKAGTREIDRILAPLRLRLDDFVKSVEHSQIDAEASRRAFSEQVGKLTSASIALGEDTRNLASALRGNNRMQGQWGESVLESLLEDAGLVRDINFKAQASKSADGERITSDEGSTLRPDMIVYLPDGRNIIIDSKATLSAYLDYCTAGDKEKQSAAAKRHVANVKQNIDRLSSKEYQKSVNDSLGHVLMFIPNDAALILASATDPGILSYAMKRNIALVGPTHLISVIMLVDEIWRKERQDRNAEEIARLGGLLYDSVASFVADMKSVERSIVSAHNTWKAAYSKLTESNRSITARAERLRDMGAKVSRHIISRASEPGKGDRN